MGSDQSTPPKSRYQENDQRNSRKFTEAEVARALENQRKLYESQMRDLIQSKATSSNNSGVAPAASSPRFTDQKVAAPQLPIPKRTPETESLKMPCLERQRTPYSHIPSNSKEQVSRTLTSKSLYPTLGAINVTEVSPSSSRTPDILNNNNDGFIYVNHEGLPRHRAGDETVTRFAPSAPPAESLSTRPTENLFSGPSTEPLRSSQPGRSNSRARPEEQDITCPTCKNRFGMRIFNCLTGHASCDNCKAQFKACGVCGLRITERRNISLEEYVHGRTIPCLNADEGCCLHFSLEQMDKHLKECPFTEIQCPLPPNKCRWRGKISCLAQHFDNFHPSHRTGNIDTEMFLDNIVTDNKTLHLIKLGNYNFVFHAIVSEQQRKICFAVQLFGTKASAAKWSYEIHVYNKREPRRKYQYVDKCFATSDPIDDIVDACAVLPLQYAMTFINEGALAYKFFIKKIYAQRDSSCNRRGRGGRGRGGNRKF